jgi:hypothetical protein
MHDAESVIVDSRTYAVLHLIVRDNLAAVGSSNVLVDVDDFARGVLEAFARRILSAISLYNAPRPTKLTCRTPLLPC